MKSMAAYQFSLPLYSHLYDCASEKLVLNQDFFFANVTSCLKFIELITTYNEKIEAVQSRLHEEESGESVLELLLRPKGIKMFCVCVESNNIFDWESISDQWLPKQANKCYSLMR